MKKLLLSLFSFVLLFTLASCDDIRETVNEIKKIAITETIDVLTEELGVENFEIPECESLGLDIKYDEESDKSEIVLKIEKPEVELSEYKDDLITYIEEALPADVLESESLEPVQIENGYKWEYTFTKANEQGEEVEYVVEVLLTEENGDFALDFGLIGAGDISELIKEELEKVENAE